MIQILTIRTSDVLIKELKRLGYPGKYDWNDKENYETDLINAYSKAKNLIEKAQQLTIELNSIQKKQIEKPTRESFIRSFISLSEFMKYDVKEHETSVEKYCLMQKRVKKYAEQKRA